MSKPDPDLQRMIRTAKTRAAQLAAKGDRRNAELAANHADYLARGAGQPPSS